MAQGQKRGTRIAFESAAEVDAFLTQARTCRVGTITPDGHPHVSALWFVWDGTSLWLNSIVKSRRFADLRQNPRISVLVDDGHDFSELRGVELTGSVETVGPVSRSHQEGDWRSLLRSCCSRASTAAAISSTSTVGMPGCG